jgi:enamine deaminase RidA (YjgF/YER057c/UK114 family)
VALVESNRLAYISGLAARAPGDGEAQVRDVFAQLNDILAQAGSDMRHLAKATYYVSDEDASTMLNKLRGEFFDPARPPAASKVMVQGTGVPEVTLTMDMIAAGREP